MPGALFSSDGVGRRAGDRYVAHVKERGLDARVTVAVVAKKAGTTNPKAIMEIVTAEEPEYVALATAPKAHIGSVADYLIRSYKGNIIVFKG